MTSLFERLDTEEAIVRGELSVLREKIMVAEERLAHLTITREILRSLVGDEPVREDVAAGPEAGTSPDDTLFAAADDVVTQEPVAGPGPLGWEVARERMLVLLAGAGRAMKVQDISAAIGEDTSVARRVETTRSRLKRLVKEGKVVEGPTAWFAIAPADETGGGGMRAAVG
ncbi:hypothetical protein [Streptomyces orinoci]|uniref:Uncharacterized protein n=1 Tax=Streptomyces orinoci TaxID=67339 RepID=A0ABV3K4T6_STRON|nr:hypothetical protein [Streptomyces orinoci]